MHRSDLILFVRYARCILVPIKVLHDGASLQPPVPVQSLLRLFLVLNAFAVSFIQSRFGSLSDKTYAVPRGYMG